jgi:hypothetical protein
VALRRALDVPHRVVVVLVRHEVRLRTVHPHRAAERKAVVVCTRARVNSVNVVKPVRALRTTE